MKLCTFGPKHETALLNQSRRGAIAGVRSCHKEKKRAGYREIEEPRTKRKRKRNEKKNRGRGTETVRKERRRS